MSNFLEFFSSLCLDMHPWPRYHAATSGTDVPGKAQPSPWHWQYIRVTPPTGPYHLPRKDHCHPKARGDKIFDYHILPTLLCNILARYQECGHQGDWEANLPRGRRRERLGALTPRRLRLPLALPGRVYITYITHSVALRTPEVLIKNKVVSDLWISVKTAPKLIITSHWY